MKKITLFLVMLGFFLTASAQYDFAPIVGPTNVASGTPTTINLNDVANTVGVPASSTGSYDSFSISVDWAAGAGNPWSIEGDVTVTTTTGSILIDPPTTGGLNSNANTTLTFIGDFTAIYNPTTDGFIDLVLNQSFGGSDADWSNIVVTLFESPTCIVPTGMATSNLSTTSVDLTWNAGDSETIWNVEYNSGADFVPGNGEEEGSVNITGSPTTSLSGLTEFMQYFVYYQADCSAANGTSEWVGPFSFITGYCESIPTSNDGQGIDQAQLGTETFTSAGDLVFEDFTATTVDLAAAITANFQVTFVTGFTYNVYIWIDFNNDLVYDNNTELLFQGETTNANPTIFDASFLMPDVPLGIYNMRMTSSDGVQNPPNPCYSGSFGVTADFTVNITEAPDCIPPSTLTASIITEDSAELTWNGGATGVSWDLEWGPTGFTPGSGTMVNGLTTTTYTLSGLMAGTAYDFYVVSNCAGAITSTVSGPSVFITATPGETCANAFPMTVEVDCDAATPITFNFVNGADIDANGENPSCDGFGNFGYWLSFTAPAIGSVIINFDGAADNIGLEVYDACGGTAVSDCTNNTLDAGDNSGVIGGLTPGNTYFAVIWRDAQSGTADVCIEEGPTCPFPINLEAINITENSADLGWTENGTATSWNIEWGPTGFTLGSGTMVNGVTVNPYNLIGLTQNTEYDFYVQAICTGDTSDFEGPFTFTTTPQTNFVLDCAVDGPLTQDYCYGNNDTNVFMFTSTDGTPLNLVFNAGFVENNWDELVVMDSDGTPFPGFAIADENYGVGGNIGGISFQSTGDTISFFINSDSSVSCVSGSTALVGGINYTVSCATCINPTATYQVVDDCANGDQFLIDVDVTSLGDATSLTITNSIDATTVPVDSIGTFQIGPFPFLVDVIVTVSNDQDVNCVINSAPIQLLACPPDNDNCDGATVALVNDDGSCDLITPGTILAATPSGVPVGSCGGDPDDDVWFQFTALSELQLISLTNIVGGFNLNHGLYEGSCGALTELYCSDDESSITTQLTIGNTYYIRIFSPGSDDEIITFDLCIRESPDNVICENATNLCVNENGNALFINSIVGIDDGPEIACLGGTPNPSWTIIQVGVSGPIEVSISQFEDFDINGNGIGLDLDVDYILWGPFDGDTDFCADGLLDQGCPTPGDCPNNTANPNFYPSGNIIDCSFDGTSFENFTIQNAIEGEIYLLLITNWERVPGIIKVEQTNSGGGELTTEIEAEITSNEVVFVDDDADPTTPDVAAVCGFDSVTIIADSPFADSYIWYADGFEIAGETSSTLTVTESNTYQVVVSDEQCGVSAESQIVVVKLYKDPGAIGNLNLTVCDGIEADGVEDFDLDALAATFGLSTDFVVSYYATQADANQAINALASPYNTAGETIYFRIEDVEAANDGFLGCRQLSEVTLLVNPIPTANQPQDLLECNNNGSFDFDLTSQDAEINTDTDGGDIVITYYATQEDANNGTAALSSPYNSSGQTIYVRVEDTTTGCFNTTSFNVVLDIVPLAAFNNTIVDYEVCPNATVPILISLLPSNFTESEVTVEWFLDDGLIAGESGLTLPVLVQGDYTAEITFNTTGCYNSVTETVIELESCVIPQGISPGEVDRLNDTFDLSSYNVTKLEIFNRNGTRVYSKTNYIDEWHGQSDAGDELPVGTYFYTMIYEGGAKKRSAWIYINR